MLQHYELIVCLIVFSIICLFIIIFAAEFFLKEAATCYFSFSFILSLLLVFSSALNETSFQGIIIYDLISFLNIQLCLGIDSISALFIFLSNLLVFLCNIYLLNEKSYKDFRLYSINLLLINIFLLLIFTSLDLFLFYFFFEAILIPIFFIINYWGSRERKIRAAYLLFFYTFISSLFMLICLIYLLSSYGTLNYEFLISKKITLNEQYFLWLGFFFAFASKIPMFPFHIWLPEAHVEAPTVGSVLLAGILLKLGIYGLVRFNLVLFPDASLYFMPFIALLSIIGIIYGSFAAIRQVDLKRIIAYSSIAHMNLIVLGIFSFNENGLQGAIFQSISHGFVASALFFLVGILYIRYHSRYLFYYSGLVHFMPIYSSIFLFFILANIAFPGTSNFIGEFILLCGIFKFNIFSCFLGTLGVILCGCYSLWSYNKVIFGNLKNNYLKNFEDLNFLEFLTLFPLLVFTLLLGIFPNYVLDYINISSLKMIIYYIF